MKIFKTILITFIFLTCSVKADLDQNLIKELHQGGKLIFIRHAYAPGSGDPKNFNLNDCSSQRNLNDSGREQSKNIGNFFSRHNIKIKKVHVIEVKSYEDDEYVVHDDVKSVGNWPIKEWDASIDLEIYTREVVKKEIG